MNILFLASWYPTEKNPLLGIFIRRHAIAVSRFHQVTVLHAVADSDMKEGEFRIAKQESESFRELIIYFGKSSSSNKLSKFLKQNSLLKKHYRFGANKVEEWYGKPDIVHLNVPWPLGNIAIELTNKWKSKLIVSEHWTGYQPEDGRFQGFFMKWLTARTLKKASFILPVSEQLMAAMKKHGLKGNFEVLPNVVDDQLFTSAEGEKPIRKLIHVSVIDDKQKNVSGLLKAFKKIHHKYPDVSLTIVGGGPDESAIKRLSNELGLTFRGVEFKGSLTGTELVSEFHKASALVMNSRFENQPVVILEALCCGLPVIAPSIGGIPEIISSKNGILFEAENEKALVDAIEQWLRDEDSFIRPNIRLDAVAHFGAYAVGEMLSKIYLKATGKC
jgi:glycosyltransferase involved in cell wall biosynthesis